MFQQIFHLTDFHVVVLLLSVLFFFNIHVPTARELRCVLVAVCIFDL